MGAAEKKNVRAGGRYTVQFLLCLRRPIAGFILVGSRTKKVSSEWAGTAGSKKKKYEVKEVEMSSKSTVRWLYVRWQ